MTKETTAEKSNGDIRQFGGKQNFRFVVIGAHTTTKKVPKRTSLTSSRNMFCKNILEIWKEISFLEISSVFKDIVLAISEFYPLAQWRANTAGHSHNKLGQKIYT